jgi:hypothetical protein
MFYRKALRSFDNKLPDSYCRIIALLLSFFISPDKSYHKPQTC